MTFVEIGGRSIRLDSIVAFAPYKPDLDKLPPAERMLVRAPMTQIITSIPAGGGGNVVFVVDMAYDDVKRVIKKHADNSTPEHRDYDTVV